MFLAGCPSIWTSMASTLPTPDRNSATNYKFPAAIGLTRLTQLITSCVS